MVTWRLFVPVLVTVTVSGADVVPTGVFGKLKLDGLNETALPGPARATGAAKPKPPNRAAATAAKNLRRRTRIRPASRRTWRPAEPLVECFKSASILWAPRDPIRPDRISARCTLALEPNTTDPPRKCPGSSSYLPTLVWHAPAQPGTFWASTAAVPYLTQSHRSRTIP